MITQTTRGFTLIELLVVIAVIGLLSSIILGQLNAAKSKGADATKKHYLASLSSPSALFYEQNGTYSSVCADTTYKFQSITNAAGVGSSCNSWANGFRVRLRLTLEDKIAPSGPDWMCIDERGILFFGGADPGAANADCPSSF